MATAYNINLINHSNATQHFWCFLDTPKPEAGAQVFAHSSASLNVQPYASSSDSFFIPLQYRVQAGASNTAVGLNVAVHASAAESAAPGDVLRADYAGAPPKQGPRLSKTSSSAGKAITIETNQYNEQGNRANEWYESLGFGIDSPNGFMGISWSPAPGKRYALTPEPVFYVSTGSHQAQQLEDIGAIARNAARITLRDFSPRNEVWVTLNARGQWTVTGTNPQHLQGASEHAEAQALTASTHEFATIIQRVQWNVDANEGDGNATSTGMIVVTSSPTFIATGFTLAGLSFNLEGITSGATSWRFRYTGSVSKTFLHSTLVVGARIIATRD